jgi:small subunit ribosomal protein S17
LGKAKDLGLGVTPPKRECDDPNCPFHGSLRVRGTILEGVVVSDRMDKTVIVEREYYKYDQKYERWERRRSRIPAHNPPCIDAREGDRVKIAECRPLSKTKSFVVIEVLERAGER